MRVSSGSKRTSAHLWAAWRASACRRSAECRAGTNVPKAHPDAVQAASALSGQHPRQLGEVLRHAPRLVLGRRTENSPKREYVPLKAVRNDLLPVLLTGLINRWNGSG